METVTGPYRRLRLPNSASRIKKAFVIGMVLFLFLAVIPVGIFALILALDALKSALMVIKFYLTMVALMRAIL